VADYRPLERDKQVVDSVAKTEQRHEEISPAMTKGKPNRQPRNSLAPNGHGYGLGRPAVTDIV
jgi:hypothetical protein